MKPALSVVLFTVVSGAGLGLLIWLGLAVLVGAPLDPGSFVSALVVAAALVTFGLLASTQHLANPRNAWQSFRRFGSSWLSREAVLAVALYPALIWFWAQTYSSGLAQILAAAVVVLLAAAVLMSTAMIYACLKTVPHWHNWQTSVGMPLYGLMSGGVLLLACWPFRFAHRPILLVVLMLLALGGILKYRYYTAYRQIAQGAPGINEALGLGIDPSSGRINARVRLLDSGHAHATFLTREFGYQLDRNRALALRLVALGLGFVLPFLILLWWPQAAAWSFVSCMAGLLVERWLFFAEARHVVRHYHGMRMD